MEHVHKIGFFIARQRRVRFIFDTCDKNVNALCDDHVNFIVKWQRQIGLLNPSSKYSDSYNYLPTAFNTEELIPEGEVDWEVQ